MDRERVHAHFRGSPAHGRRAWRPLRSPSVFVIGLGIFTAASAFAALAPSIEALNIARALQGVGGAIVTPLTLTLLSAAVPANRRGLALGAWGGIGGSPSRSAARRRRRRVGHLLAVDLLAQRADRPRPDPACLAAPATRARPELEARPAGARPGQRRPARDRLGPGAGQRVGWGSPEIVGSLAAGAVLVVLFVLWELRAERRCCRCASSATGRSRRRTSHPSSCSSGCSARSSCSRSSSRPSRATRPSVPACGSCRGRRCR